MKTITVLILITAALSSCKKEQEVPPRYMDLSIDGEEIQGIIPSLRSNSTGHHLTASTTNESHTLEINLGDHILPSYTMHPGPIQGDEDPVNMMIEGYLHTLKDSAGFTVTMQENDGLYSGSFNGQLFNQEVGEVSINSTFENL